MSYLNDLFLVTFGEIDIPPFIFALIIFLSLFVFLAVVISTTKLIQSLINDDEKFIAHNFPGKYLDCGSMSGYIKSSLEISKL